MSSYLDVTAPTCIGVAMNNSTASSAALRWACRQSEEHAARLVVASVADGSPRPGSGTGANDPEVTNEIVSRIVSRCPSTDYRLTVVQPTTDLARALVRALAGCDLVVVGAPDSSDHRMLAFELARLGGMPVVEVTSDGAAATVRTDGMLLGR